ncbi:unnamed protein product [Orchesella dallaii]|uniref:Uncharacterized protein n=1 Tax=Orchesella dallaii TaxID=48710 RepID=A0ABP1QIT0_9HEXA
MWVVSTIEKFLTGESGDDISFLVPFFNFFYYLLLIPFKTVLDPETNQYCIKTHVLHKILCILFHAIIEVFMISLWIYNGLQFQKNLEPSIVTVFDFVSNFCFFITTSLTIFILWRRRDKFLEVVESTRVTLKRTNGIKTLIYTCTAIAIVVWGIINWFILHDPSHYVSFHSFDRCITESNGSASSHHLLSYHCPNIWVTLLHTGFNIIMVHGSLFYVVVVGPFLIVVLALAQLGKKFRNELEMMNGSRTMDIEKIQETVLKWIAYHTGNTKLSVENRLKLVSLSNEMAADPIALASRYFCVTYHQFSSYDSTFLKREEQNRTIKIVRKIFEEMAELAISLGESLFLVPFNVFYYFGFVPFRTRYNEETNGYQLETCSVQKIICAFLSFFAIIFQIYIVVQCYLQFKKDSGTNIVALFETVANFTYFIASLLVIFQVWTKQQDYLQFLERSRCKREPAKFGTFHLYIGMLLFCVVSIVLLWILANDSGHYIREITNNFYNSTSTPEENVISYGNDTSFRFYFNKVVFCGYTLVQMHTATFSILAQWIFIVLTLVLRRFGEDFQRELETTKHDVGIEKGILLYRNLKETMNFTREMYGDFILMFYISSVTYFAETPHILMRRRGDTEMVILYIGLCLSCMVLTTIGWFLSNDTGHYATEISGNIYNSTSTAAKNVTTFGNETDFRFYFKKVVFWGYAVLYMHTTTFFVFAQGIFFVLTMVLRRVGAEFRAELENTKDDVGIERGILLYRKLKSMTNFTREMYGDYILTFYISSVTYFAEAPHILMGRRGDTEKVILFAFIIFSFVWLWVAEFHYNIHNSISDWITYHTDRDSVTLDERLKLLSISSEMSTDPIALSCRCFCITYKHLCSMLGVVVTYGVIVVQLNSG